MSTKQVSVRLAVIGGEKVRTALEGVGEAGKRGFGRRVKVASAAAVAAATAAGVAMIRSGLQTVDAQAKLATIQVRLAKFAPEAERAAIASQLFSDRASLVFGRIDSATLQQATQDVRDFGVVVSDQDAAQIERTNDAISRLGLIWRGLSNQLAVAAAPALESVADAMAAVSRTTGPLGMAIRGLFDNLGRLVSITGTFAAFMAGRWVAGLVAAALSVRGLATALVVLRGALIRTGIGALIVGAGELVYQFGKLVSGAGGFGGALELMGTVARAVWNGIGTSLSVFGDRFRAMGAEIEALWLRLMRFLGQKWADFLSRVAPGFNRIADVIGAGFQIDALGVQAWVSSFDAGIMRAEQSAEGFRARADATLASAFDGAREAVAALLAAVRGSSDETEDALGIAAAGAQRMSEALDQAEAAAGRAGAAGKKAGSDTAAGATAAVTGWDAVTGSLSDYAAKAGEIGSDTGQVLVGAFSSAESAIGDFVRKGKLDFRDLVTSMIADLARLAARKFLLGPLAGVLSGVLGGVGGIFANILHDGGLVGSPAPARMVPAMAFAGAPRMHSGGWAGIKPDEVPAILQRGERVLSRREAAGYGGRGAGADGGTTVNVTIMARDAESFRQSRTQVAADIARAVSLGRRGM